MPITDFLERNAKIYPNDVALVEVNPDKQPSKDITWREYSLIETSQDAEKYRREITWKQFDVEANKFANLLKFTTFFECARPSEYCCHRVG